MRGEIFQNTELLSAHPEIVADSFFRFSERHGFKKEESRCLTDNTKFWRILLVNSALVRFAPVFEREEVLKEPISLSQGCVKGISDWVGRREGFLTFFEQLGTGSQTHSRKEAISIFWGFFEESLGMDPARFLVTVFDEDQETYDVWRELGFVDDQILKFRERNFFDFANGQVKGPVSALVYDRGLKHHQQFFESRETGENCHSDCDCGRYSELADIGFFTSSEGISLVDTGIGLERLTAVLSGQETVFKVGSLKSLTDFTVAKTGQRIGVDKKKDTAIKIIADHARSIVMLLADDVYPANKGAGYVTRRIIRRTILAGRKLDVREPFLYRWTPELVDIMAKVIPSLGSMSEQIAVQVRTEEEKFFKAIGRGEKLFPRICRNEGPIVSGETAFLLYDTHGLPLELTEELAAEKGWSVDVEGFRAMFQ